jgi:hypothetical protein
VFPYCGVRTYSAPFCARITGFLPTTIRFKQDLPPNIFLLDHILLLLILHVIVMVNKDLDDGHSVGLCSFGFNPFLHDEVLWMDTPVVVVVLQAAGAALSREYPKINFFTCTKVRFPWFGMTHKGCPGDHSLC